MATKLFKSLTIGGDTYKLDDGLGFGSYVLKPVTIPTANTRVMGAEIDITAPGMYIFIAQAHIGASTTTANKYNIAEIGIKFNGSSSYNFNTAGIIDATQGNTPWKEQVIYGYHFTESLVPAKVCICVNSSQTSSDVGHTSITSLKLITA